MSKSKKVDINQMFLKAHKQAVKTAIETAARTGTSLVSREGTKVKMVKPNVKYMGYAPVDSPKKKAPSVAKKIRLKK